MRGIIITLGLVALLGACDSAGSSAAAACGPDEGLSADMTCKPCGQIWATDPGAASCLWCEEGGGLRWPDDPEATCRPCTDDTPWARMDAGLPVGENPDALSGLDCGDHRYVRTAQGETCMATACLLPY